MRYLPFLLLIVRVQVPDAWACSCDFVDPVDAAEASGVAYVGEFVSIGDEDAPESAGFFGCGGQERVAEEPQIVGSAATPVVVRVLTPLHGDVLEGEELTLSLYRGGGGDCGVGPAVGDRWIFYRKDETDLITYCSPEKPWSEETEDALREAFGG